MANRFTYLLERYLENQASEAERSELMQLLSTGQFEDQIKQGIADRLRAEMHTDPFDQDEVLTANNAYDRAQQILDRILAADRADANVVPLAPQPARRWWLAAAAAVTILLVAGYILWKPQPPKYQFTAHNPVHTVLEEINRGADIRQVTLDDSTRVTLHPGAHLVYPIHFSSAKREVYLTGEAFFEVTKDKARPFFVYSKTLVTEVVGTSFTVRANNTVQTSEVAVVTGKVRVAQNEEDENLLQRLMPASRKVMLTPNHRAVYQSSTEELVVRLVEKPRLLAAENMHAEAFRFRAVSLAVVLKDISYAYGIEIEAQNDRIRQCTFTGDLSEIDDLYTRLELICQSVGASYVIRDAKILITGNGC